MCVYVRVCVCTCMCVCACVCACVRACLHVLLRGFTSSHMRNLFPCALFANVGDKVCNKYFPIKKVILIALFKEAFVH